MKTIRGKRLSLKEKKILKKLGYNPENFLRCSKTADNTTFVHRSIGTELSIRT